MNSPVELKRSAHFVYLSIRQDRCSFSRGSFALPLQRPEKWIHHVADDVAE